MARASMSRHTHVPLYLKQRRSWGHSGALLPGRGWSIECGYVR